MQGWHEKLEYLEFEVRVVVNYSVNVAATVECHTARNFGHFDALEILKSVNTGIKFVNEIMYVEGQQIGWQFVQLTCQIFTNQNSTIAKMYVGAE